MKIALYCTCGDATTGKITPDSLARSFILKWEVIHTGPDCKPCDAKTAARARRRKETLEKN